MKSMTILSSMAMLVLVLSLTACTEAARRQDLSGGTANYNMSAAEQQQIEDQAIERDQQVSQSTPQIFQLGTQKAEDISGPVAAPQIAPLPEKPQTPEVAAKPEIDLSAGETPKCAFKMKKVTTPGIDGKAGKIDMCAEDYFRKVNFVENSFDEEYTHKVRAETSWLSYVDMVGFDIDPSYPYQFKDGDAEYNKKVRERMVKDFSKLFFKDGLSNKNGSCELKLTINGENVAWSAIPFEDRDAGGQPGTRRMIGAWEHTRQTWDLYCPDEKGVQQLKKNGGSFSLWISVFQNAKKLNPPHHLLDYRFTMTNLNPNSWRSGGGDVGRNVAPATPGQPLDPSNRGH